MFTIRAFEKNDTDYQMMTNIDAAIFPEYERTADEWRHMDETLDPKYPHHRDFIEFGGKVIAFGEYGQSIWHYHPRKYFLYISIHPAHEHPDVRQFYFNHVLKIFSNLDLIAITSGMLEDRKTHIEFLTQKGFKPVMREPLSRLELGDFDPTIFAGIVKKVRDAGIRIASVAELRESDLNWQHKLYELEWELMQDVPSPDPTEKRSFEMFVKNTLEDPGFLSEGYFVALDGDQYVGQTALWVAQADKEKFLTGLTGVKRSYRRKGIATVLKLRSIAYAQKRGIKAIETGNEENNPMFQINLRLGYKAQPAWVEFEKRLQDEETGA
jgi:mycothiol synthase